VNILLVAVGGAFGSVARFLLSSLVYRLVPSLFPFGTFAVNVVG
jgi:fluoride exporter